MQKAQETACLKGGPGRLEGEADESAMKSHFGGMNDRGKRAPPAGARRESLFWRERGEHGNCSKCSGRHEMKGRGQLAAS